MRLIDADALKTQMFDYYQYSQQLCGEISELIENAPTVDAICPHYIRNIHDCGDDSLCRKFQCEVSALPRKTGKWIYEGKRGRFPACRCSICGNVENADWAMISGEVNYCPHCGAKMEGE